MVLLEGIKVTVHRHKDDKPYHEYVQRYGATGGHEVYIEAISGESFYFVFEIDASFNFRGYPTIRIGCSIDEGPWDVAYMHARDMNRASNGIVLGKQRYTWTSTKRFIDCEWMRCGLAFAELPFDESKKCSRNTINDHVNKPGHIRVEITRGRTQSIKRRLLDAEIRVPKMHALSEDDENGRHVSHFISYLPTAECNAPMKRKEFHAGGDASGPPIGLVFQYRSKEALALLNIIPRSGKLPLSGATNRKSGRVPKRKYLELPPLGEDEDDDDEEMPPQRVEKEEDAEEEPFTAGQDQEQPPPDNNVQPKTEHDDFVAKAITAAASAAVKPPVHRIGPKFEPAIKIEDDDTEVGEVHSAREAQTARASTPSVSATQGMSDRERKRRRTLLKMRLAETKLEREEMKLEREIFELGE